MDGNNLYSDWRAQISNEFHFAGAWEVIEGPPFNIAIQLLTVVLLLDAALVPVDVIEAYGADIISGILLPGGTYDHSIPSQSVHS